jgi:hypothetical protein
MEITISFGYWMRRQRKALVLTQQALAEQTTVVKEEGCNLC